MELKIVSFNLFMIERVPYYSIVPLQVELVDTCILYKRKKYCIESAKGLDSLKE